MLVRHKSSIKYRAAREAGSEQPSLRLFRGFLPEDAGFRVRLDVLNVFNTRNWRNFELFPGNASAGPNPNFGNHLDGVHATRTAKLSFGFNW
jgi:hypothetical protein